jgi:small subunit ribosomal protein S2
MKRYIFTERNGIYIIDLQQSLDYIDRAYEFIRETVAHGGSILYVGTKKQAQEAIAEQARRVGMPFVNQRWLGGMLTNFTTVFKRLQRLKELEEIDFEDVAGSGMTKKELLHLRRERDKLDRTLGGIRDMSRVPSAVWVVDTKKEHIAVSEARKLGIPVVAILDTNCDPDEVTYPIPGNDDAIRSVSLLTRVIADAVADGLIARAGAADGEQKPSADLAPGDLGTVEPLPEWERELLVRNPAENGTAAASAAEPGAAHLAGAEDVVGAEQAIAEPATAEPATAEPATAEPGSVTPGDTAASDTAPALVAEASEEQSEEQAADADGASSAESLETAGESAEAGATAGSGAESA